MSQLKQLALIFHSAVYRIRQISLLFNIFCLFKNRNILFNVFLIVLRRKRIIRQSRCLNRFCQLGILLSSWGCGYNRLSIYQSITVAVMRTILCVVILVLIIKYIASNLKLFLQRSFFLFIIIHLCLCKILIFLMDRLRS